MKYFKYRLSVSVITTIISILVLIGWQFNITFLKSIVPGYISMKANTAVGFLLIGILGCYTELNFKKKNFIIYFLSIFILLSGLINLIQYHFLVDFKIDEFLFIDTDKQTHLVRFPGRMAENSAICFFLFGIALLFENCKSRIVDYCSQLFYFIVVLISFLAMLGYLYKVPTFFSLNLFNTMAFHTAILFVLNGISVASKKKNIGLVKLFYDNKIGNIMARWFFPFLVLLILLLGYIRIQLSRSGLLPQEFGIVTFAVAFILLGLLLIWFTSTIINKIDEKRYLAEQEIIKVNQNLEILVKDRTKELNTTISKLESLQENLKESKNSLEVLAIKLSKQNLQLIEFAQITSHNLRSPVSNLVSIIDLYKKTILIEEREKLFSYLENVSKILMETLNELMEALRIQELGKNNLESLDIQDSFNKIVKVLKGQILASNARIVSNFTELPSINYNKIYFESILLNLISNSIKYKSNVRDPEVLVVSKMKNGLEIIKITDNGSGIDLKKNGDKIFGLHKTFHRHKDARGVGLFLIKTQIEALGGKIFVESELNKGSKFIIYLNKDS